MTSDLNGVTIFKRTIMGVSFDTKTDSFLIMISKCDIYVTIFTRDKSKYLKLPVYYTFAFEKHFLYIFFNGKQNS